MYNMYFSAHVENQILLAPLYLSRVQEYRKYRKYKNTEKKDNTDNQG